jgi:Escherichia/Staphylococcus phage prohead protease
MPWHIVEDHSGCSASKPWAVILDSDGSLVGCHPSEAAAKKQLAALNANVSSAHPVRDLIRMVPLSTARAEVTADGNTMTGYPVVYNQPTEIDSLWEGTFTETIAPGALTKTLKERGDQVQVLFNHGLDPQLGDKPLGVPKVQRENTTGLYVEVELDHANTVQQEIVPRLRSGSLAGMSFRFQVVDEDWSDDGSERTIRELKLYEYGPVTFPAYQATTVGIRSLAQYNEWRREAARTISTAETTPTNGAGITEPVAASTSPFEEARQQWEEREELGYGKRAH